MKAYHDGKAYFCPICGKAGFKSQMALRGHMSMHSKKVEVKKVNIGGATTTSTTSTTTNKTTNSINSTTVSGLNGVVGIGGLGINQQWALLNLLKQEIGEMRQEVADIRQKLTNEIPHRLAVSGVELDFGVLGKGLQGFLMFVFIMWGMFEWGKRSCVCVCEGERKVKQDFKGKVLEKVLMKGIDRVLR